MQRSESRFSRVSTPVIDGRYSEYTSSDSDNDDNADRSGARVTRPVETVGSTDLGKRSYRSRYEDFTTIDWVHDQVLERRRRQRLQQMPTRTPEFLAAGSLLYRTFPGLLSRPDTVNFIQKSVEVLRHVWDASLTWVMLGVVAILMGVIAASLEIVVSWLTDLKTGVCKLEDGNAGWYLNRKFCCWHAVDENSCSAFRDYDHLIFGVASGGILNFAMYAAFGAVFSVLSFLIVRVAPYAASSGLPEVKTILGGFVIRGFLGIRTGFAKTIALAFSAASGLSIGKEVPLVHIACCIGNIFPRLFRKYRHNESKKREILSAAVAAGIGVAFGAPIGGVLFSLEEASSFFPAKTLWRSFFCSIVAAVVMQEINPFRTGKLVQFQASYTREWHAWELFFFILLGAFGGIYGVYFVRLNLRMAELRQSHPFWTGRQVAWKDWFRWVPPLRRRLYAWYHKVRELLGRPVDDFVVLADDEGPSSSPDRRRSSRLAPARKWWNPSRSVIRRYFQEIVMISLLTSCISYGNPFLRGDMTDLLGGLLQECPSTTAVPPPSVKTMNSTLAKLSNQYLSLRSSIPTPMVDMPVRNDAADYGLCYDSPNAYGYAAAMWLLFITALVRATLTTITFGLRIPAGVFIPTMVVGACVGRILGMIVAEVSGQAVTPATYALIGAASTLSGVSRSTIAMAVIIFELTGGAALLFVVPVMIAVATAKFVSDALDKKKIGSISDAYIRFHNYPLLDNRRDFLLFRQVSKEDDRGNVHDIYQAVSVGDAMTPISNLTVLPAFANLGRQGMTSASQTNQAVPYPHTVESLLTLLRESSYQGFPIVDRLDGMSLLGFIRRVDLQWVLDRAQRRFTIANTAPCYFILKPQSNADAAQSRSQAAPVQVSVGLDSFMSMALHARASTSNLQQHHPYPQLDADGQYRTYIDFSPWINSTPLTVAPNLAMDLAIELFKKLGLRYLLVTKEGTGVFEGRSDDDIQPLTEIWPPPGALMGLLTKKDLLRFIEMFESTERDAHALHLTDALERQHYRASKSAISLQSLAAQGDVSAAQSVPATRTGSPSGNADTRPKSR